MDHHIIFYHNSKNENELQIKPNKVYKCQSLYNSNELHLISNAITTFEIKGTFNASHFDGELLINNNAYPIKNFTVFETLQVDNINYGPIVNCELY